MGMREFLLVFFVDLSMKIATSMFTIISKVLKSIRHVATGSGFRTHPNDEVVQDRLKI